MALPKLNDQPKFEITVPSTKEMHRFRPFLVKEEKVLLIALESNDQRQMLNAIADTVDACSNGSVKVNELTTYDIEYLFTQLRGKSVGETTKLQMICKECENTTEAVINLDDIKMTGGTTSPLIEISPNISVELSYPAYVNMMNDDTIMGDDASAAKESLIKGFKLNDEQATYILDMPLRRLTKMSKLELESEQKELKKTIADLTALLKSDENIRALISTELTAVAKSFATPRRTRIGA